MKFIVRFLAPVFIILAVLFFAVDPAINRITLHWFQSDLDSRSELVANAIKDSVDEYLDTGSLFKLKDLFSRVTRDERLDSIAVCDAESRIIASSTLFPASLSCMSFSDMKNKMAVVKRISGKEYHLFMQPFESKHNQIYRLILLHDFSSARSRVDSVSSYFLYFLIAACLITAGINIAVAQWSRRSWTKNVRGLINDERILQSDHADIPVGEALPVEVNSIALDLKRLITSIKYEQQAREIVQTQWTPQTLKLLLSETLSGQDILVVSNREPYIHQKIDSGVEVQRPASGLVTALEPVMRACSGTWIAHGSGSADKEVVDKLQHVKVPPQNPAYTLRRVWISEQEERGYYYGFSNEGLWPLCHIAHVRPIFRPSDWDYYVEINRRFADAVVAEATVDDPVILVQDYHFALLPRMVREKLPNAIIITFWHIPWPNPETFGICPWREQLLDGLLGSSILGFHTRFYCNNFFDTIDRYLEARIDRETLTLWYGGAPTSIKSYPISIEWPRTELLLPKEECDLFVRQENHIPPNIRIGIGVDRLDYTKGVIERFRAVERLLELEPKWIGRFSFIQIGAPTRNGIARYRQFEAEVRAMADKINQRFGSATYQPIMLKVRHHEPDEISKYYRVADLCCVSSLHDGMNLVAKEYIAARDDEQGVLILSQFTGAASELPEAIIVNPYHVDQCASAFSIALEMPAQQQKERMHRLRAQVEENNAYRWAGEMLLDAAKMKEMRSIKPAPVVSAGALS